VTPLPDREKELTEQTVYDTLNIQQGLIRWRRGDLIGQGMFGRVYQALNLDTGELLAVKTYKLNANQSIARSELINIKRELLILRSLDHPNIVKYFQVDVSQEDSSVDIITEYVPSGSLFALLEKYKGLSESVIQNYTKQLLEGLSYLHENEVVHRDLKSANILVTENSTLKLTDFGCSRRFDSDSNGQSRSFKGSPYWMSPEMVLKLGHSYPSDIWSLGCLIIEMATGRPPWSNYSKYSKDVLKLIAEPGNLPDIPKISTVLKEFLLLCLTREPHKRPSARDLLCHEFITSSTVNKCYDSVRTSANVFSVRESVAVKEEQKKAL
jgi:serine/threonine protein kinase